VDSSLPWIALALFLCSLALWKRLPGSHSRFRATFGWLGLWILLWAGAAAGSYWNLNVHTAREIARAFIELALVQIVLGVFLDLAIARVGLPRFVTEAAVIAGYVAIVFNLFLRLGFNVTGIFATSAVVAAVIGLSLQDTLGNIASFIALQFEDEIKPGDFIQCAEASGWVQYVRLRHTAVTTSDGDRILLPNSVLTRVPVTIQSQSRRTFVPFTMSYARNPQELIDAVAAALNDSPIPEIADDPQPSCIILEMAPGYIKYAAVVWILRPGQATFAVSSVLRRIYFSLERAGIPVAEITNLLEMKTATKNLSQTSTPVDILHQTPIFRLLDEPELIELAARLDRLAFAPGERIIRQGDDGKSMYFVAAGEVTINFMGADGSENLVANLGPGEFFGEASLLTGAAHSASAVAASRVDCYRLDKSGLEGIVARRPELLEDMSVVMAHRQKELAHVREAFDRETSRQREEDNSPQLLAQIRRFFGIESDTISRV
jgi:small-conductance mechanosensitive channel/CRP-like cAMP-binding protein